MATTPATTTGESGKTYGYQSTETAPSGGGAGGSALAAKRDALFKAFEDVLRVPRR